MLANYTSATIRNLLRNRAYALINLAGLAIGFATTLLIALYVRDEFSFNRFIPDADRIFQLGEVVQPPGNPGFRASVTSADIVPAMQQDFPEVDLATRMTRTQAILSSHGDENIPVFAVWADPTFMQMFQPKLVVGQLDAALSQPDGMVLTRKTALKLFGREAVVGETLLLNDLHPMRINAVIDDWPSNSTIDCDAILPAVASYSPLSRADSEAIGDDAIRSENTYGFLRLRSSTDIDAVRARLREFTDRQLSTKIDGEPMSKAYSFTLTALPEVHFLPPMIAEIKPPAEAWLARAFIGIATLIVLLSAGNFVSMMTAKSARRATEVGVRKAAGATNRQIMYQFFGEGLFLAALAMILAIALVSAAAPAFASFLQRDIRFNWLTDPQLAAMLVSLTILVGMIAGAYPALVMARFRPSSVLKGTIVAPAQVSTLRILLVVGQFGALITLLVTTFTIHRQIQYAIEERLRLPTDQIYFGGLRSPCPTSLTQSVVQVPGVSLASCMSESAMAASMGRFSAIFQNPAGGHTTLLASAVDFDFFKLFDVKLLAGRLLSAEHGADTTLIGGGRAAEYPAIVINESAVRALGFTSPAQAVGQFKRWGRLVLKGQVGKADAGNSEIVGVVEDFSIGSVREQIEPTVYYVDPSWQYALVLKLDGHAIPQTVRALNAFWPQHDATRNFQGTFLNQHVDYLYFDIRRQSTIFLLFTFIAITNAGLGLLGLALYTVERRTKEIGLRKVMGASRIDILRFLAWKFMPPLAWANLIAWPCAYLLMKHWLEGFAYHVDMTLVSFLEAGLLATVIAITVVAWYALTAARAKPMAALRYE